LEKSKNIVKKLIKKLSLNANSICIVEKRENAFYHLALTLELCTLLQVKSESIEGKSIQEILPLYLSNQISKHYEEAWKGKEVLYKIDFPFGSKQTLYKVLSPVKMNGEVTRLISHIVTADQIPSTLRHIA
jgi:hypothetical protein